MLKLLNVDAAGERALRVVAYFDQLSANEPDLDAVVRAAAVIADCPAGLELRDRGLYTRFTPEGTPLSGPPPRRSNERPLVGEGGEAGRVWVERDGAERELDEFIVERFALTASSVIQRQRPPSDFDYAGGFSDPALAQLMVNERASEAERSRAAQLIGLQPASLVQLVALEVDPTESLEDVGRQLRERWSRQVFVASLSRHLGMAIVVGRDPISWEGVDLAGRASSGAVVETLDAPMSWAQARETLRFAGAGAPWPRHLDAKDLGALRLLAQLDPALVLTDPDVAAVGRIAAGPGGMESIRILDYYLHADSLRSAARSANFHHSSMQSRLKRIGAALGIDIHTPAGRQRAGAALLLWRLAQTH